MTKFQRKVCGKIRQIPRGKVTTYKLLAEALDTRAYRAVGGALSKNSDAPVVPCHRVVRSDGRVGGYSGSTGNFRKKHLLRIEGVEIKDDKVKNLEKVIFSF